MASSITVVGSLQQDPDLRFAKSGKPFINTSIREVKTYKDERTSHFYDLVIWGDLAEHVAGSLEKGDRIIVSGSLEQQKWETSDGEKRSKVAIVAFNVGAELSYVDVDIVRAESEAREPVGADAGF